MRDGAREHARVVADVSATLALRRDAFSWTASFNRPRLRYEVRPKTSKPKAIEQIAAHVRAHADESGLVYCLSRRDCEVVCEALGKQLGARVRELIKGLPVEHGATLKAGVVVGAAECMRPVRRG